MEIMPNFGEVIDFTFGLYKTAAPWVLILVLVEMRSYFNWVAARAQSMVMRQEEEFLSLRAKFEYLAGNMIPKPQTLRKLAQLFEISAQDFMMEDE